MLISTVIVTHYLSLMVLVEHGNKAPLMGFGEGIVVWTAVDTVLITL